MTDDAAVKVQELIFATPNDEVQGQFRVQSVVENRLQLIGWTFGNDVPVKQVEVVTRGAVVATVIPKTARPDVAAAYPQSEQAANSGFEIAIEADGKGTSSLELRAVLDDGTEAPLGELHVLAPPRRWSDVFRRA